MVNCKSVASLFIVLTVTFAVSTAFLMANQNPVRTQMVTSVMMMDVLSPLYSVNIAYKAGVGPYLTNGTGWTLYFYANDVASNRTSRCTGACLRMWPAFYVSSITLPPGLNEASFSRVNRPDGVKQLAYNGSPLYYFMNDTRPGDVKGQGFRKLWFAYTLPKPNTTPNLISPASLDTLNQTTPLISKASLLRVEHQTRFGQA